MRGVAEGYQSKHQQHQDQLKPQDQKALMVIQDQLQQSIQKIYRRLSLRTISTQYDEKAKSLGQLSGEKLTIHRGVTKSSDQTYYLEQ